MHRCFQYMHACMHMDIYKRGICFVFFALACLLVFFVVCWQGKDGGKERNDVGKTERNNRKARAQKRQKARAGPGIRKRKKDKKNNNKQKERHKDKNKEQG